MFSFEIVRIAGQRSAFPKPWRAGGDIYEKDEADREKRNR
jgi:hypothetical protein